MRCSAALSCLLPVRDKRGRARLDDQTGSGVVAVGGVGVLGAESVDAGGLTEDLRRGQRAAPADRQQRRRKVLDQLGDFGFQFVDLGGEGAAVPHQGACQSGNGAAQSHGPASTLS